MLHRRTVLALLAACSTPPSLVAPLTDASLAFDARMAPSASEPRSPIAPAPAVLPSFANCPAGFERRSLEGIGVCDPFTTPERAQLLERVCPIGELHGLAADDCVRYAAPCPSAALPATPSADTIYVLAGATGSGTLAEPLGDLRAALAAARGGQTVVVGDGRYVGHFDVPQGVTLRGVCPERVTLAGAAVTRSSFLQHSEANSVVVLRGGTLENVSVRGTDRSHRSPDGVFVVGGHNVVRAVDFADLSSALVGSAGDIAFESLRIANMGIGVRGLGSAHFVGEQSELSQALIGLVAFNGTSTAQLSSLVLHDVHNEVRGQPSGGIIAYDTANVSLVDSALVEVRNTGVMMFGAAKLRFERNWVEGGIFDVTTDEQSEVDVSSSVFSETALAAFSSIGTSKLSVRNTYVHRLTDDRDFSALTRTIASGAGPICVLGNAGAQVSLEQVACVRPENFGIGISGAASLTATDLTIRRMRSTRYLSPLALGAYEGSGRVELHRVLVSDVDGAIGIGGTGVHILEDLTVEHVGSGLPEAGLLLASQDFVLRRAHITDVQGDGLSFESLRSGGHLRFEDVAISQIARSGITGSGTEDLQIERVDVADSGYGGLVIGNVARLSITDGSVRTAAVSVPAIWLAAVPLLTASRLDLDTTYVGIIATGVDRADISESSVLRGAIGAWIVDDDESMFRQDISDLRFERAVTVPLLSGTTLPRPMLPDAERLLPAPPSF